MKIIIGKSGGPAHLLLPESFSNIIFSAIAWDDVHLFIDLERDKYFTGFGLLICFF